MQRRIEGQANAGAAREIEYPYIRFGITQGDGHALPLDWPAVLDHREQAAGTDDAGQGPSGEW